MRSGELGGRLNESFRKGWSWLHLFGTTAAAHAGIQLLGFAAGLVIVRALPPTEYALYVLCLSITGAMNVLADSGVTAGVMAEGGKQWRDRSWLGQAIVTGEALRLQFARIATMVLIPPAIWLLARNGATLAMIALLSIAILLSFIITLTSGLYSIPLALHQRVGAGLKVGIWQAIARLGLTVLLLAIWKNAFVAIASTVVAQYLMLRRIKSLGADLFDAHEKSNSVIRSKILGMVGRRFPECLYYCVSGQITIWLASLFGGTLVVAQLGALSRIGQLMIILSGAANTVFVPRFARLTGNPELIVKRYIQAQIVLCVVVGLACAFITIFSGQCLWLLGASYSNLTSEVILVAIGAGANVLSAAAFGMSTARGYVPNPVAYIGVNILAQVVCIMLIDVGSVAGLLKIGIVMPLLNVLFLSWYIVYSCYHVDAASRANVAN